MSSNVEKKEKNNRIVLTKADRKLCIEKILTRDSEFLSGILMGILEYGENDVDNPKFLYLEFNGDDEIMSIFMNEETDSKIYKLHDLISFSKLYSDGILLDKVRKIKGDLSNGLNLVTYIKGDIETSVIYPVGLYLESLLPYTTKIINERGEEEIINIELSPAQKKLAITGNFAFYKNIHGYEIMFKDEKMAIHYLDRTISNMKTAEIFDNLKAEKNLNVVSVEMRNGIRDLISFYNSHIPKTTTIFFKNVNEYREEEIYQSLSKKIENREIPIVFTIYIPNTENILEIFVTSISG